MTTKPPIAPDEIGKYERSTDALSEDNDGEVEEVADLLAWLEKKVPEHEVEEKSENRLRDLLDAGLALEGSVTKFAAIAALREAKTQGTILQSLENVLKDIFYAGKDLLSSNRVKTSLTILAGIALGAAIGSVIPIAGTAVGATFGGAIATSITTGLAALGGELGLGILGAFGGSWVGKKISDKAFKHEKRFEISKRVTRKIKSRIGISSHVSQMINGYLYNRAKRVSSPLCKQYYKSIRTLAILEADPTAMEKVASFFCQELELLGQEMQGEKAKGALLLDQKAVVYILKKLQAADGLSLKSKVRIRDAFNNFSKEHKSLPAINIKQDVGYDSTEKISPKVLEKAKERFVEALPSLDLKESSLSVNKKVNKDKQAISYHYHFQRKADEDPLPDMEFRSKRKPKRNLYETTVLVDGNQLTDENEDKSLELLMAQAKAYRETTGNDEVEVTGKKKEGQLKFTASELEFAARLMVAVLKAGMHATITVGERRFTPEERDQVQERVKELTQKASLSPVKKHGDT